MTERKTETSNKQVQTTIHCFPHVLLSDSQNAKVFSDRGCQTAATTTPDTPDINFYAVLEFTPYQVIAEGSIREVDLPRKALLQWKLSAVDSESNSSKTIFLDLKHKSALKKANSDLTNATSRLAHHFAMQRSVTEQEVQTTLSVAPHVLDTDEVANVFTELAIQTSITCLPNDSISNILPLLKANLSHVSGYSQTPSTLMNHPPENEPEGEEVEITGELIKESPENAAEPPPEAPSEEPPGKPPEESSDEPPPEEPPGEPSEEPPEESPDQPPPEEPSGEPPEEPPEESPDEPSQNPAEDITEQQEEDQTSDYAVQVDILSASQVESHRVCSCRTDMLNQMVSKLQTKASALRVAPVAFPPDVPFGDRLVEVLNTITAVLQTEMATLMEVYTEEEKAPCACKELTKQKSLKEIQDDPRSCKCPKAEAETNTDNNQTGTASDPRSCKCGARTIPQQASSTIAQGSQKEMRQTTTLRQVANPNTNQTDTIREDVVEETVRTVTVSINQETIIQGTISTTVVIGRLPGSPTAENLTVKSNLPTPVEPCSSTPVEPSLSTPVEPSLSTPENLDEKLCTCSKKPDVEVIKSVNEEAATLTETADLAEPGSEATEAPTEFEEISEIATTVPLPEGDITDEAEAPTEEVQQDEIVNETEQPQDEAEPPAEEVPQDEIVNEATPLQDEAELPAEEVPQDEMVNEGKPPQDEAESPAEEVPQDEIINEAESPIEEETPEQAPNEATEEVEGQNIEAAPDTPVESPTQPPPEVVGDSSQNRRLSFIPCECHPTETGAAVPTLVSPEPSAQAMPESELNVTDMATTSSHIDDDASAEKTIKFEILLKKGVKDVKSVSATSAIVVRATLSCPDTSKDVASKISSKKSLPDLREQVIRLKVIYKTGPADQETQIEELLSPGRPVTIAPNKSHSSRVNQKASKISASVSIKTHSSSVMGTGKSDGLVCAKGQSAVRELPYITDQCSCTPKVASRGQTAYPKQFSNLPIEIEEVPFSSMACPLHPQKTPACVPACKSRSTPSSHQPNTKTSNAPGLQLIITYTTGNNKNDLQPSSLMYEDDASYEEPYMNELVESEDATTGVQTDIALGDKLQSESLNSLGAAHLECKGVAKECGSKIEIPWQNISLEPPGSYNIQPAKRAQQVGVMTEGEEVVETGVGEELAIEEVPEEVVDEGEQAGDAGEAEGSDAADEPPANHGERPNRRDVLLYEIEDYKDNEPYMEGLYRAYPDSDEGECGSHTEIPWKDIILPEHCKIKKVLKQKKCTCKSRQEKLSGMFIPSNTPPRNLEVDENGSLIALHIGFDEPRSTIMRVPKTTAASISFVSTISDIAQKPKRVPKKFSLVVDMAQNSVSFTAGVGQPQTIPIGSILAPTGSQPFSISTAFGGPSSAIINIKSSTSRPFPSQRIPVPGDKEHILNIVNPATYGESRAVPTETRSCTATNVGYRGNNMPARNISSMPQISSQKTIKATVSLKKLGGPEKVVTQTMNLCPGENRMALNIPDAPMTVNVTMSTPNAPAYTSSGGGQASCASPTGGACSSPCPPPAGPPKEVFSAAKCPCKDKVKLDTFRQDPVIAALEAYEAEMRPLKQALTQLQQKIRNLNMPEMKGCLCTTTLQNPPPPCGICPPTPIQSGVPFSPSRPPQGACPYFQPARFRAPITHAPYGRLPPPTIPPRFDPYMGSSPNYEPPNGGGHRENCRCEREESQGSRSGGHRRHYKENRSNRDHGKTYAREDLAMEAKRYGMYPDYRGRRYPNERAAYEDSFIQESRHKSRRNPDKYKTRHAISVHSSGNVTSDCGGYDIQGASDADDSFHQSSGCRSSKNDKYKRSSNQAKIVSRFSAKAVKRNEQMPCRDTFDVQMRDGQAVKTSPEEFLSCPGQSTGRRGPSSVPSVVSKTRIHIKLPRN